MIENTEPLEVADTKSNDDDGFVNSGFSIGGNKNRMLKTSKANMEWANQLFIEST